MQKKSFLKRYIQIKIVSGDFKIGAKIPSERYFSNTFNISRTSVQSVMKDLVNSGTIISQPKIGYVVSYSILNLFTEFPMLQKIEPKPWEDYGTKFIRRFFNNHQLIAIEEFTPLGLCAKKKYLFEDSKNVFQHFIAFGIIPREIKREVFFSKENAKYNNILQLCDYQYYEDNELIGKTKLWIDRRYMDQQSVISLL